MTRRDLMTELALRSVQELWELEILAVYEIWLKQIEATAAAGVFQRMLKLPSKTSPKASPWSEPPQDILYWITASPQLRQFLTILARLLEQDGFEVRAINTEHAYITVRWTPRQPNVLS